MPIRAENRARYPADWRAIVAAIRDRSGDRCEGCGRANRELVPSAADPGRLIKVVLTCAHLNHTPEDCRPENLRHWCQRCHNRHDAAMRSAGRLARRHAEGRP